MVCLRNICINTLQKGAKDDEDNNNICINTLQKGAKDDDDNNNICINTLQKGAKDYDDDDDDNNNNNNNNSKTLRDGDDNVLMKFVSLFTVYITNSCYKEK
jgi:hypothetical protein